MLSKLYNKNNYINDRINFFEYCDLVLIFFIIGDISV